MDEIVAEEVFMSRITLGLVRTALALALVAAFVPGAQAYQNQTPKRHPHHKPRMEARVESRRQGEPRREGDIYVDKRTRSYLDPGTSGDIDSEDLYFNDTRFPHYLVGPGLLQRFDEATGMDY
jgi:hypothetical protein